MRKGGVGSDLDQEACLRGVQEAGRQHGVVLLSGHNPRKQTPLHPYHCDVAVCEQ